MLTQMLRALRRPPSCSVVQSLRSKTYVDWKLLTENSEVMKQNIENRKCLGSVEKVLQLQEERRTLVTEEQALRTKRNNLAKLQSDSYTKEPGGQGLPHLAGEGLQVKEALSNLGERLSRLEKELETEANLLPNWCHPEVPVGPEANARVLQMIDGQGKRPLRKVLRDLLAGPHRSRGCTGFV